MARPNLTSVRIRHRFDSYQTIGWVDPAYGLPLGVQNVPLVWDVNVKMYRPFSSIAGVTAVAEAITNFAGFSDGYVQTHADGSACPITVVRSGIVEILLNTAAEVTPETLFTPSLDGTLVSNDTFAITAVGADSILKAVKVCSCTICQLEPCPPDVAAAALVSTGSLSTAAVYPTVRTVFAYFNVAYTS